MAEATKIERITSVDAVKLSEGEIVELRRINRMLNTRGYCFAVGVSFTLGVAWYLLVNRSISGLLTALYPSMFILMSMMMIMPVHMWRVWRFSKRIGVANLYLSPVVLLDEDGNELKDQTR